MADPLPDERLAISVKGIVQGVGFRPFIYQLAVKHDLKGWVTNTSGEVRIEVEGAKNKITVFLSELETEAPPQSHITNVMSTILPPAGYANFEIRQSVAETGKYQMISPDLATCGGCRTEIFDPLNRRFGYPFTN